MTKAIKVGNCYIGGNNKIAIQSMTNTDTKDIVKTSEQISNLQKNGCDIVRLSVYDMDCIKPLKQIIKQSKVPLVADVHFDKNIAIESIKAGISKLRINPGNIGTRQDVRDVAKVAKEYNVPIRVGANSGSISKELLQKYGGVNEESMVQSALENVNILEKEGFYDICISVKCSNVPLMIKCYNKISKLTEYPLHLGVTEAGTRENSAISSSIGIGSLLINGIGDTIRVSVTGDPLCEPIIAKKILRACGKIQDGLNIISCPTCARTGIDVEKISDRIEQEFININKPLKVAVMGCVVNGPGEAKEADIGIAGGKSGYVVFKEGKVLSTFKNEDPIERFIKLIREMV